MFACSVCGVRSTGLPTAANGAHQRAQRGPRRLAQRGHLEPFPLGGVGGDHRRAARHGDHRHAARGRPPGGDGDQRLDRVEELLRLLRQHHPRAGAGRAIDLPGAGQRAGVRAGGAAPGIRAAALEHDDRLAPGRALGGGQEARAVAQRLHEAARSAWWPDRPPATRSPRRCPRRPGCRSTGTAPRPRPRLPRWRKIKPAVRAALRDDGDAAGQARQIPEVGAVEPHRLGVHAHAVGPDQPQPARAAPRPAGAACESRPVGVHLAESGREHDRRAHPAGGQRRDRRAAPPARAGSPAPGPTPSGSASIARTVGTPRMGSPDGFTGWTPPPKPPSSTFLRRL